MLHILPHLAHSDSVNSLTPVRVITIGETMAMVTSAYAEPLARAVELRPDAGGAESNVASHLAALGVRAAWVSALGDDVLGQRVRDIITDRGVDTRWVIFDVTARTGVYFKDPGNGVLYYRDGSAASRLGPHSIDAIRLEAADVVHISGITPALSPSCAALTDTAIGRVTASQALMSFDVNYRPALWPDGTAANTLRALARRADIVFTGLDEAHDLWGCERAQDVRAVLPEPTRLIVKDGGIDAVEFDHSTGDDTCTSTPAIATQVVEAVGAGDAFAAGYLAALLHDAAPAARLRCGHERARLVLSSTSDFTPEPALPGATTAPSQPGTRPLSPQTNRPTERATR